MKVVPTSYRLVEMSLLKPVLTSYRLGEMSGGLVKLVMTRYRLVWKPCPVGLVTLVMTTYRLGEMSGGFGEV